MTPNDIYALPDPDQRPWYHRSKVAAHLFGEPALSAVDDDQVETAERADGEPLAIREKLHRDEGDANRSASILTASWKGKPFAVVIQCGRGGDENSRRIVTCLSLFFEARDYAIRFLPGDPNVADDVAPAHVDVPELSRLYGNRVMQVPGRGVRLVSSGHLDAAGRVLFDEESFHEAFERILRPAYGTWSPTTPEDPEWRDGIRAERMQGLAAEVLAASFVAGTRVTRHFGTLPESFPCGRPALAWTGVIAATGEGTYAAGLSPHDMASHFAWARRVAVRRLGDADLYDALAHEPAVA